MIKALLLATSLYCGVLWAACSPSKLQGKHPPLAYVLEMALIREVWTPQEAESFLASEEWYNPFSRVSYSDLRSRYIEAFNRIDTQMTVAQRNEVKISLRAALSAHGHERSIEREASDATQYVYNPKPFMELRYDLFATAPGAHVGQGFFQGRPVFLSHGRTKEGKLSAILFDPFNADAAKHVVLFGGQHFPLEGPAAIFDVDGKTYGAFPVARLVFDLETFQDVSAQFKSWPQLPPQPPDRVGEREILWTATPTHIDFRDKAAGPPIPSFPSKKLGPNANVHDVRVFEDAGNLLAAVRYSAVEGLASRQVTSTYVAIVDIGKSEVLNRRPLALPPANRKVSRFEPVTIDGRTWIFWNYIDAWLHSRPVALDPRLHKVKEYSIPSDSYSDIASFVWQEKTYLVFADMRDIRFYEEATGTQITIPDFGGTEGKYMKVFEYNHALYLVVHSHPFMPRIIQITTPSRGPASVGDNQCDKRMRGNRHPLVTILERAVAYGVWSYEDLTVFAKQDGWSNPFEDSSFNLVKSQYRQGYARIFAHMDESGRQQARAQLQALVLDKNNDFEVSEKASRETKELLAPQLMPAFDSQGKSLFGPGHYPTSVGTYQGRPIITRQMLQPSPSGSGGIWHLVLLDPFNPDSKLRVGLIPEERNTSEDEGKFFEFNGKHYLAYPDTGIALDLATREFTEAFGLLHTRISKMRLASTPHGPGLLFSAGQVQMRPLDRFDDWHILISEQTKSSDIAGIETIEGRDILAVVERIDEMRTMHFLDLSGKETFMPLSLNQWTARPEPGRVRIFRHGGELYATLQYHKGARSSLVTVNMKTGKEVVKFTEQNEEFELTEIGGQPYLYAPTFTGMTFTNVLTKESRHVPADEVKSNIVHFRFRTGDMFAAAGADKLVIYDFANKLLTEVPLPGLGEPTSIHLFRHQGSYYLVASTTEALPRMVRLTF